MARAEQKGFKPFQPGVKYMAGDKVYFINRDKSLILAVMGQEPLQNGVKIMASTSTPLAWT